MKESFSALGRFLAILVVVAIAIAGVTFLLRAVPLWIGAVRSQASTLVGLAFESLRDTWFVTGAVSVLAWQFSQLRRSSHSILTRLLVFLVSSAVFVTAGYALGMLNTNLSGELSYGYTLREGGYYNSGSGFVYISEREGLSYSQGLRIRHNATPRFAYIEEARQTPNTGTLLIPRTEERLDLSSFRDVYWNETLPPSGFAGFFSSAEGVSTNWISEASLTNMRYIGFVTLAMLMWNLAWSVVRLTRWPLFNGILVVLLVWGVISVLALEAGTLVRNTLGEIIPPDLLSFLPHATLLLLTLVLTVINVLETPFRQWQRNVAGG